MVLYLINLEVKSEADLSWNRRLFDSGLGTNRQSVETGIRFVQTQKFPYFLTFTDEVGNIIGQLLISTFDRFSQKSTSKKFLGKLMSKNKTMCQWEYGPIIFDKTFSSQIYEKLGEYFLAKKFFVTGWQHPLSTDGISVLKNKFNLIPWSTFMIDLSKPLDVIYKNIDKKSGQKNISRSENRGVTIEEISEHNLSDFLELRNDMKEKQGVDSSSLETFSEWWKLMKPLGLSGYLARKNNEAVGGLLFSFAGKHIIEIAVARSELDTKEKLYSQDLIKWNIIKWGHENKIKYYNLAGFNPNPQNDKERGIFNYKKKWGGIQMNYFGIKSL